VVVAEDQQVIEALTLDRAGEPLGGRVLPGAVWRRGALVDPHEEAIERAESWPGRRSHVEGELLAQGNDLEGELTATDDEEEKDAE